MCVCMYVCVYQDRFKVGPVRSFFLLWGCECGSCFVLRELLRSKGGGYLGGNLLYEFLMNTETINLSPPFSPPPHSSGIVVIKVVVMILLMLVDILPIEINDSRDTYYLSGDPMHHSARRVFDPLVDKLMPCFMAHFRMNSQM